MILVFNSGSSSLKFKIYRERADGELESFTQGALTHLGRTAQWTWREEEKSEHGYAELADHSDAARFVLERLHASGLAATLDAVGHRVVHGGDLFRAPVALDDETLARLHTVTDLAPLHNPLALQVIGACRGVLGTRVPMVAVFDTAFHAALPEPAREYALPSHWVRAYRIRRYGFHGLAHRSMYERYRALTGASSARVVSFQLGNGCSACAIRDGRSVETSMGYTPTEGLIMSTRSGDVDPGVLIRLSAEGVTAADLEEGLNRAGGLLALSDETDDMQRLLALEEQGHPGARRSIAAFCHRARKYLGAYLAVLGGADAVLFGGGIGEHAPAIRARITADMAWCGLQLDATANAAAGGTDALISPRTAKPAVYVIAVDEEMVIARDTRSLLSP